mmetsp:Transcript_44038/g.104809  ORF Transcript_44038/g.104809 Transcript_44038/m.104809 type:complete len:264 (+) Transcript_44038:237-1028(+)
MMLRSDAAACSCTSESAAANNPTRFATAPSSTSRTFTSGWNERFRIVATAFCSTTFSRERRSWTTGGRQPASKARILISALYAVRLRSRAVACSAMTTCGDITSRASAGSAFACTMRASWSEKDERFASAPEAASCTAGSSEERRGTSPRMAPACTIGASLPESIERFWIATAASTTTRSSSHPSSSISGGSPPSFTICALFSSAEERLRSATVQCSRTTMSGDCKSCTSAASPPFWTILTLISALVERLRRQMAACSWVRIE